MNPELKLTSSHVIRILARASAARAASRGDLTMDEVAAAAECLGIPRASVIEAASPECARPIDQALLGTQTSFSFRAPLGRSVAAEQLEGMISAAGRRGGRVLELPGSVEWHQQGRSEWIRVTITNDAQTLDIAAQRSTGLAFIQWFGPGAGVLILAGGYSLFAADGPPPSLGMVVAAAVFGFAVARAAWSRIVEQWQAEMARFAARLEISLEHPTGRAPVEQTGG
jgi:hypothetical protein